MGRETSIAAQVLRMWGASVESLPTSTKEEADWLATLDGCRLLVEEKSKYEDPATRAARHATLTAGQVHGSTYPLTGNNRLSGIVRKAARQLSSTGKDLSHDLRILWFTSMDFDAEAKHFQLMATLYGSTRIFELDRPVHRPCYFFRNGDFFRYGASLDGAIVSFMHADTVTMKLCLNPYSLNWEALRDSPYGTQLSAGLVDPIAEDAAGVAYIADTDIPRQDEAAVLRYVEEKYKLERAMNIDLGLTSAAIRVGDER